MTYRKRRLLFFFSIFAFLILSGPLLLYTFGYRFSFSNFDIHKTGGIFIHTNPPGTNLIVKDIERTTSYLTGNAFIQNLRPASYPIHVSRKGYQSWEKIVDVEPQAVTELFPVLMPATPTITVLKTASSTNMLASPNASLLILYRAKNSKHTYEVFDPNLQETLPFSDALSQSFMASVPPDARWNWNTAKTSALIETSDNWIKLTRQNNAIHARSLYRKTPLAKIIPKKPRLMVEDPRNPNAYFLLDRTNFVHWNTETSTAEELLQSIGSFLVGDTYLILWDMQTGTLHTTTLDATQPRLYATSSLPAPESRMEQIGDYLLLVSNKEAWLLSNSNNPTQLLTKLSNLQNTIHTDAYVLSWSEHKISIHWILPNEELPSFQKNQEEILYESDGTIQNVMPYPEEHYIIIQENNTLYTLELDGRGGTRNRHALYKGDNLSFFVPPHEKILYTLDNGTLLTIELP